MKALTTAAAGAAAAGGSSSSLVLAGLSIPLKSNYKQDGEARTIRAMTQISQASQASQDTDLQASQANKLACYYSININEASWSLFAVSFPGTAEI